MAVLPALRALDVDCPVCHADSGKTCTERVMLMPMGDVIPGTEGLMREVYRAPHVERGRAMRYKFMGVTA